LHSLGCVDCRFEVLSTQLPAALILWLHCTCQELSMALFKSWIDQVCTKLPGADPPCDYLAKSGDVLPCCFEVLSTQLPAVLILWLHYTCQELPVGLFQSWIDQVCTELCSFTAVAWNMAACTKCQHRQVRQLGACMMIGPTHVMYPRSVPCMQDGSLGVQAMHVASI
jgi:hypothetical protein